MKKVWKKDKGCSSGIENEYVNLWLSVLKVNPTSKYWKNPSNVDALLTKEMKWNRNVYL